jgi:hypothetical protein
MIEVQVLIDNFKDLDNYSKKITITRNGKEKEIQFELLQKGDIYKISKERANYLSEKGIVKAYKESKSKKEVLETSD